MTIDARRKTFFSNLSDNSFAGGLSMAASEGQILAYNTNHLLSQGRQLIPNFSPDISGSHFRFFGADAAQGFTTVTFYLLSPVSSQSIERIWTVGFSSLSSSKAGIAVASLDNLTNIPVVTASVVGSNTIITYPQYIVDRTALANTGGATLHAVYLYLSGTVDIIGDQYNSKFAPYPTNISLREIDRPRFDPISSSAEGGVDINSFGYNSPIFSSDQAQYSSFSGVARNTEMIREKLCRTGIFAWARPVLVNGSQSDFFAYSIYSGSSQTVCKGRAKLPPRYQNETSGTMRVLIYAGLSGSSTATWSGNIVVSTSLGFVSRALWASSSNDRNPISGKIIDVPIFRQNPSSSLGIPTPYGVEETSIMDYHVYGYLDGDLTGSVDRMVFYTVQGFDLDL